MRVLRILIAAGVAVGLTVPAVFGVDDITLAEAFIKGRPMLNLRYRYENVIDDAFKLTNKSLGWASFLYSYINKVHRINGATWDAGNHLLNGRFKLGEGGKYGSLTPYAYLLDFKSAGQFGLSTATYGVEYQGTYDIDADKSMNWEVELATQGDYGDNPLDVDADYLFVTVEGKFKPLNVRLGFEVLGGNIRDGRFTTPLATLHKFNGWADKSWIFTTYKI